MQGAVSLRPPHFARVALQLEVLVALGAAEAEHLRVRSARPGAQRASALRQAAASAAAASPRRSTCSPPTQRPARALRSAGTPSTTAQRQQTALGAAPRRRRTARRTTGNSPTPGAPCYRCARSTCRAPGRWWTSRTSISPDASRRRARCGAAKPATRCPAACAPCSEGGGGSRAQTRLAAPQLRDTTIRAQESAAVCLIWAQRARARAAAADHCGHALQAAVALANAQHARGRLPERHAWLIGQGTSAACARPGVSDAGARVSARGGGARVRRRQGYVLRHRFLVRARHMQARNGERECP